MCLSPISLPVREGDQVVGYNVVPCGKCVECLDRKQKDIMQVFLGAALRAENIVFATFTYDDSHVPKMFSVWDYESGSVVRQSFDRSSLELDDEFQDIVEVTSLRRKDWRLWLKAARMAYYRFHGRRLNFSYVTIGEYGKLHKRPHYHTLFFDLTFAQVEELCVSWDKGFHFCEQVDRSQSVTGVCRYMAKYLYKGFYDIDDVLNGLSEKPRIMSSKNLVKLDSSMVDWLTGKDLGVDLETFDLSDSVAERLVSRRKILIDDFKYSLGHHYLDKIFKEVQYDEEGKRKLVNYPLQNAISAFIRKRVDSVRDSQLRQSRSFVSHEDGIAFLEQIRVSDEASLLAREESKCKTLSEYYKRSEL